MESQLSSEEGDGRDIDLDVLSKEEDSMHEALSIDPSSSIVEDEEERLIVESPIDGSQVPKIAENLGRGMRE